MASVPLVEHNRSSSSSSIDSSVSHGDSVTNYYQKYINKARERRRRKSLRSRKPSPTPVPDGDEDYCTLPFIKDHGRLKSIPGQYATGTPKYIKISYQALLDGCNVALQNQKFHVGDKNDPGNSMGERKKNRKYK